MHVKICKDYALLSEIARIAIEGDISSQVPASLLRNHNNATIYLDEEVAKFLNKQNV